MKKINPNARYHETNEWVTVHNNIFTIGITDFAQTVFGKVISIEFPRVGDFVEKNQELCMIESDKITTEVESPLSGKIYSINQELKNNPTWLNESPYEKGWLVKIEISDPKEWETLMTADEYQSYMNIFYNKK